VNEPLSSVREEMRQGFAEMRQGLIEVRTEMREGLAVVRGEMREGLVAVRGEMQEGLAAVRGEMREGLAAVRGEMREGLVAVRGEMQECLASVRDELQQGFAELHQGMAAMGRRLDALDDRVRANGVLLEALRAQVQQLVEAHAMLDERVERYRRQHEVAHQEILALLRTSYQDLDRRVTRLEARIGESGPAV